MLIIWSYIFSLVIAALISFVACFKVRQWAIEHQIFAKIRNRDMHKKPIPRLGGLGIVAGFMVTALLISLFWPSELTFVQQKIFGIDKNLFGVMLGGFIVILTMVIDDLKGLKWGWKLLAQFVAASSVAYFGITINWFANPFGPLVHLGDVALRVGSYPISWGQIFVILWIVLIMNVVNWLDGLDGLASGISIIVAGTIFMLAISPRVNQVTTAMLAVILIGSIGGFMPFNFYPARMFLGDTGSMFIGYMLAVLAIISGGKVATASLVMGIPLLDGAWVVGNRMIHHKSIFEADQSHIHHRLMKAGLSMKQTVLVLYGGSIILGFLALRSGTEGKFWSLIWLIGAMLFLSIGLLVLDWVRKKSQISNIKPQNIGGAVSRRENPKSREE